MENKKKSTISERLNLLGKIRRILRFLLIRLEKAAQRHGVQIVVLFKWYGFTYYEDVNLQEDTNAEISAENILLQYEHGDAKEKESISSIVSKLNKDING
jgi:hypothetical protein